MDEVTFGIESRVHEGGEGEVDDDTKSQKSLA